MILNRYANVLLSAITLIVLPKFFIGYNGGLHFKDLITRQQFAVVMERVNSYVNPSQPVNATSFEDKSHLEWAKQKDVLSPLLNKNTALQTKGPVTITQAKIGAYTIVHKQKPYYLPVQISKYESGYATRGKVNTIILDEIKKIP